MTSPLNGERTAIADADPFPRALAARPGYRGDPHGDMAQGWSHGLVGAVVAAWPAVSLVGSYELLVWLIRTAGTVERGVSSEHPAAADGGHHGRSEFSSLPRKEGGRASRPAVTTPSGGKIPEIT